VLLPVYDLAKPNATVAAASLIEAKIRLLKVIGICVWLMTLPLLFQSTFIPFATPLSRQRLMDRRRDSELMDVRVSA
jgi:galactitol-specific phosphotransferase system IIC component